MFAALSPFLSLFAMHEYEGIFLSSSISCSATFVESLLLRNCDHIGIFELGGKALVVLIE